MKTYFLPFLAVCLAALVSGCANSHQHAVEHTTSHQHAGHLTTSHHHAVELTTPTIVDAACGQCQLGLKTEKHSCDLAVRIDGKSYFVENFTMKQFGNAHGENGMCKTVRKAKVTGHGENGRFMATSFELLPVDQ